MALTRIFEPITINKVEIPNRIVRTAHGTHLAHEVFTDEAIAYHVERAKGGCGLSVIEASGVHPSSQNTLFNKSDAVIPGFQALMKALKPYGMRMFQQLFHGGHQTPGIGGTPPWSASAIPSPAYGLVPEPMGTAEIEEITEAFAQAARRCREGGLDGVEIHGAHGYLIQQFLSPLTNVREDKYGGPLENRMRFLQEIARRIRKMVGRDYVVGVRLSASQAEGGIHEAELRQVAQALIDEDLIDYLSVSYGDYFRMDTMVSGMQAPSGYELHSSGEIARGMKVPRMVSGRFRTLEEAEQVLRDGTADMVALVRAQIADPMLVKKTREGRAEEVRPCIACNHGCIGGLIRENRLGCAVNPAVGYELTLSEDLIEKTAAPKHIIVVGGGPSGMEAARVAALSGHRVTLFEATPRLGGAINAAKKAPRYHTMGDITDWLERELYRLGVEMRLSTPVDIDAVEADKPDLLVVATGSLPRMDGIQAHDPANPAKGFDQPHVVSSHDLLLGPARDLGKTALVLDDTGHFEAAAVAAWLIGKGVAVTFVTKWGSITPYADTTMRTVPVLEQLYEGDFTLLTRYQLVEIGRGSAVVRPAQGRRTQTVPADLVVLVTPNQPLRDLYDEARARGIPVRIVGDARAPRDLQVAIREGHRAIRQLGQNFM